MIISIKFVVFQISDRFFPVIGEQHPHRRDKNHRRAMVPKGKCRCTCGAAVFTPPSPAGRVHHPVPFPVAPPAYRFVPFGYPVSEAESQPVGCSVRQLLSLFHSFSKTLRLREASTHNCRNTDASSPPFSVSYRNITLSHILYMNYYRISTFLFSY